ncbi:MAG: serine/threonine protein kinase, partial [bacterium]|nr:serine/threonine protein kinase [bacterium]
VVYLAERADNAFEQQVAIKLVHALGQGEELTRRFALERQLLARLEHPGITRILDAGTTRDGSAYLVMEYAPGENLDVYCDRLELSLGERLRLVCEVCEVVHHAHRKLVVHRDLKPSNILVTVDGRIKLLDFGIAKLVEREGGESSTQTVAGTQPFTPDYASPEQILGDAVSTATDVYSLGVVLYELLTGERPFRVETRSPGELVKSAELRRMELPSKRFSRLDPDSARRRAALRSSQPRIVEAALTGDLDRIVAKALDPDPELRYTSIDRLADDLQRFLAGLPVRARRATWQYRSRKFISRHRILVSSIVSVSLLILGGFGTAVWQWQEALTAGERAELSASRMQNTNRFLVSLFEAGNPRWNVDRKHKGPETRILDVLEEASRRLDTDLATGPVERADLHHVLGDAFLAVGLGDRATSHFERSSELRQAALGELHEDTARALYYEAVVAPTLRQQISKLRRSIEIETRLERPSSNFPYALIDGAWRLMLAGQIEEASSWLERGRAIVERDFPDAHPLRNLIVLRDLELAILTGRLELTESFPELVASPDASFAETTEIQRAAIEGYRARSALLRGRIEDAILLFRSALARSFKVTENAQGFAAQRWRALLVQALLLSEALDEAEREAEGLNPDDDLESGSYFDVPALLGRANLSRARGNLPGCERRARKAMALIRREVVNPNLIAAQAQTVLGERLLAGGD